MIEMLGVLAIIGVLSAGGIMGYSTAMENYKVNKWVDDMYLMSAKTRSIFSNSKIPNPYEALWPYEMHNAGIIPDELYKTATSTCDPHRACYLKSPWNTNISLVVFNGIRPSDGLQLRHLRIFLYNVPASVCVKLASKNWGQGRGYKERVGAWINASDGSVLVALTPRQEIPFQEIETACPIASYMSWEFWFEK